MPTKGNPYPADPAHDACRQARLDTSPPNSARVAEPLALAALFIIFVNIETERFAIGHNQSSLVIDPAIDGLNVGVGWHDVNGEMGVRTAEDPSPKFGQLVKSLFPAFEDEDVTTGAKQCVSFLRVKESWCSPFALRAAFAIETSQTPRSSGYSGRESCIARSGQ